MLSEGRLRRGSEPAAGAPYRVTHPTYLPGGLQVIVFHCACGMTEVPAEFLGASRTDFPSPTMGWAGPVLLSRLADLSSRDFEQLCRRTRWCCRLPCPALQAAGSTHAMLPYMSYRAYVAAVGVLFLGALSGGALLLVGAPGVGWREVAEGEGRLKASPRGGTSQA